MAKSMLFQLVGAVVLLMILDGCVYRDPYVKVSGGYSIVGWPCALSFHSKVEDADWLAMSVNMDNQVELSNVKSHESRTLDSLEDVARHFEPGDVDYSLVAPRVEEVISFTFNDHFVAGESASGYFLLDVDSHRLREWSDRRDWARSLTDAGLSAERLADPTGIFEQSRDAGAYVIYSVVLVVAVSVPFLRRRRQSAITQEQELRRRSREVM